MLTRGSARGTRWWYVAYSTLLGSPPKLWRCTLLVDDRGKPFTGGGGCAELTGGRAIGSSFGFAHIAGRDFVSGETHGAIDFAEVQTRSGTALTAPPLPVPGRTTKAWVIELPTTGDVKGYLPRAQAVIDRISTVANGVRSTIFRADPP